MYTDYFNLREKPFNLTPSPRFLYLSESHKEALALLTYGVMERKGFVLLTGEVGTGKTTILHTLLSTLDKRVECVHLSNPLLSASEFIDYLSHAVFKTGAGSQSKTEFLLRFEQYLRRSAQQQSNFLLVIDEAQKLSFDLLEEIRLLSNMETADEKLINIFLVGQPELNQKLNEVRCRPLLQRISVRHHISPLNLKETGEYLFTRLKVAGAKDAKGIFPAAVIRAVHRLSKGYPRMINILADNALLSAYSNGTKRVSVRMVEQCYADLHLGASSEATDPNGPSWRGPGQEERPKAASRGIWKWGAALSVAVAATAIGFMLGNGVWTGKTEPIRGGYESHASKPAKSIVMQPISPPAVEKPETAAPVVQTTPPPRVEGPDRSALKVQPASPPRVENPEKPALKVQPASTPRVEKPEPPGEPLAETLPVEEKEIMAGSAPEPAGSEPGVIAGVEEIEKEAPLPPEAVADKGQPFLPHGPSAARWLVAKKGDTLSKLAVDVYGRVDERILTTLQKSNPSISNIHWIAIGQEIYFPPVRPPEDGSR